MQSLGHSRGLSSLDLGSHRVDVEGGPGADRLDEDYFHGLAAALGGVAESEPLPWTAAGPVDRFGGGGGGGGFDARAPIGQRIAASLRTQLLNAKAGWSDSLRWKQVAVLIVESPAIRWSVIKGSLVSLVVVLVIFFFELAFFPSQLYPVAGKAGTNGQGLATSSSTSSINTLWFYPVIAISYYMASSWTRDVVKGLSSHGKRASLAGLASSGTRRRLLQQSYQPILFLNYLVVALAMRAWIPWLGSSLSFCFVSFVDAYYCFDPVMASRGWPVERRLRYVESRWAYMTTFGLLPTLVSYFHPSGLLNLFLFMAIYPFCTVLALLASPLPRSTSAQASSQGADGPSLLPIRVPIFLPTAILYRMAMRFAPPASEFNEVYRGSGHSDHVYKGGMHQFSDGMRQNGFGGHDAIGPDKSMAGNSAMFNSYPNGMGGSVGMGRQRSAAQVVGGIWGNQAPRNQAQSSRFGGGTPPPPLSSQRPLPQQNSSPYGGFAYRNSSESSRGTTSSGEVALGGFGSMRQGQSPAASDGIAGVPPPPQRAGNGMGSPMRHTGRSASSVVGASPLAYRSKKAE